MFRGIASLLGIERLIVGNSSKTTAKNRLEMVLVQDRSGLSAPEMELFQKDLLAVIEKYFTLEDKDLSVEWQRNDSSTALVINTPVCGRNKGPKLEEVRKKANANHKNS